MKRADFKNCVKLATSNAELPSYLSEEMDIAFGGCAEDTKRRFVTREQVASMIRGYCLTYGNIWLWSELENIELLAKRFDLAN
jgi:hypothetical protein